MSFEYQVVMRDSRQTYDLLKSAMAAKPHEGFGWHVSQYQWQYRPGADLKFRSKKGSFLLEGRRLSEGGTYYETKNLYWFRCSWSLKSY